MADLTPIPMGIPWDPWDPSLPHSHAYLYLTRVNFCNVYTCTNISFYVSRINFDLI